VLSSLLGKIIFGTEYSAFRNESKVVSFFELWKFDIELLFPLNIKYIDFSGKKLLAPRFHKESLSFVYHEI
jgi:hypothetical protein